MKPDSEDSIDLLEDPTIKTVRSDNPERFAITGKALIAALENFLQAAQEPSASLNPAAQNEAPSVEHLAVA